MWLMLQKDRPEDYVIGTGKQHSVEEFLHHAFSHVGLNYQDYVKIDKNLLRPAEVETLKDETKNSLNKFLDNL